MGKYVVMRRLPRHRAFQVFNMAAVSKDKAQKDVELHKKAGAKSSFRIKRIDRLSLKDCSNMTPEDIAKMWRKRR